MNKKLLLFCSLLACSAYAQEPVLSIVKDINANGDSRPQNTISHNNTLFFSAETEANGRELYISDGSENGTILLKDIYTGESGSFPEQLTVFQDKIIFTADDGINGNELWITDGTANGTLLLKDINPGSNGSFAFEFIPFDGKLYFRAEDSTFGIELWATDGTTEGTVQVKDIRDGEFGSNPSSFAVFKDKLYFRAVNGFEPEFPGFELWSTDGTAEGTQLVADIHPTENGFPENLMAVGDFLYFSADDGIHGTELWKTDGTFAGTSIVKDINAGASNSLPAHFIVYDNKLFFSAYTSQFGREIWATDGTDAGTVMLLDLNPGIADGVIPQFDKIIYNGKLMLTLNDGVFGAEIWQTDGTEAGTSLVADIYPGSDPSMSNAGSIKMFEFGGKVYFRAINDYSIFNQLWVTDGTADGTIKLLPTEDNIDVNPLGQTPYFAEIGDTLYFTAGLGNTGVELWKYSEGSLATTVFNKNKISFYPNPVSDVLHVSSKSQMSGVAIYNINGQVLLEQPVNALEANVSVSGFARGVYFLKVSSNQSSETFKIIKK